jgi:hypothetical protein
MIKAAWAGRRGSTQQRLELPLRLPACIFQTVQKLAAAGIVLNDRSAMVTATHDLVDTD